jgi:hypothetical protein
MKYAQLTPEQTLQAQKEVEHIKKEVDRIKYSVEIGETLADLKKDERYKKVFDEFYLKEEVIRETMLLSEKYFLEADQRQSLQDGLIAKAHFNDWVNATVSMQTLSASRLAEHENRLRELNDMLVNGYPLMVEEATPPEGVPNGE